MNNVFIALQLLLVATSMYSADSQKTGKQKEGEKSEQITSALVSEISTSTALLNDISNPTCAQIKTKPLPLLGWQIPEAFNRIMWFLELPQKRCFFHVEENCITDVRAINKPLGAKCGFYAPNRYDETDILKRDPNSSNIGRVIEGKRIHKYNSDITFANYHNGEEIRYRIKIKKGVFTEEETGINQTESLKKILSGKRIPELDCVEKTTCQRILRWIYPTTKEESKQNPFYSNYHSALIQLRKKNNDPYYSKYPQDANQVVSEYIVEPELDADTPLPNLANNTAIETLKAGFEKGFKEDEILIKPEKVKTFINSINNLKYANQELEFIPDLTPLCSIKLASEIILAQDFEKTFPIKYADNIHPDDAIKASIKEAQEHIEKLVSNMREKLNPPTTISDQEEDNITGQERKTVFVYNDLIANFNPATPDTIVIEKTINNEREQQLRKVIDQFDPITREEKFRIIRPGDGTDGMFINALVALREATKAKKQEIDSYKKSYEQELKQPKTTLEIQSNYKESYRLLPQNICSINRNTVAFFLESHYKNHLYDRFIKNREEIITALNNNALAYPQMPTGNTYAQEATKILERSAVTVHNTSQSIYTGLTNACAALQDGAKRLLSEEQQKTFQDTSNSEFDDEDFCHVDENEVLNPQSSSGQDH